MTRRVIFLTVGLSNCFYCLFYRAEPCKACPTILNNSGGLVIDGRRSCGIDSDGPSGTNTIRRPAPMRGGGLRRPDTPGETDGTCRFFSTQMETQ